MRCVIFLNKNMNTVNRDILAVILFWFIWCLSWKCQNWTRQQIASAKKKYQYFIKVLVRYWSYSNWSIIKLSIVFTTQVFMFPPKIVSRYQGHKVNLKFSRILRLLAIWIRMSSEDNTAVFFKPKQHNLLVDCTNAYNLTICVYKFSQETKC